MSGCLETERYLKSCQTEFWQGVFRAELDYLTRCLEGSEDILSVGCGLGVKGESIFESRDAAEAALYIIRGRRKVAKTGEIGR